MRGKATQGRRDVPRWRGTAGAREEGGTAGAARSSRRASALQAALLAILVSVAAASGAQPFRPDGDTAPVDWETIDVFVERARAAESRQVTAVAMIDAPVEVVWQVLVDYDRLGKDMALVQVSSIRSMKNRHTQVELVVDLPWPLKDLYCPLEFTEDRAGQNVTWHNNGGCRGKVRGRIHLEKVGDGTRLQFSIAMKPDNDIPQWLLHWAFKQHLPREICSIRVLADHGKNLERGTVGSSRSAPQPGTNAARVAAAGFPAGTLRAGSSKARLDLDGGAPSRAR